MRKTEDGLKNRCDMILNAKREQTREIEKERVINKEGESEKKKKKDKENTKKPIEKGKEINLKNWPSH